MMLCWSKNYSVGVMITLCLGCVEPPVSYNAEIKEAGLINEDNVLGKEYSIDTNSSIINWIASKPTGRHEGTFNIHSGHFIAENETISGGSIIIDMTSIQVIDLDGEDKEKLTNHLQSSEFFDLGNHPESNFDIINVEELAPGEFSVLENTPFIIKEPTHKVTGNFRLRGIELQISFPAKIIFEEEKIIAEARFNIDRTKWGVSWGDEKLANKLLDSFAHNLVNIGFHVEALNPDKIEL
jgi:polyisoprenoid-binding protein YceI